MHITRHVQNWRQKQHELQPLSSTPAALRASQNTPSIQLLDKEQNNEDGYLDFLEIFEERVAEVSAIAIRLTEAQSELSARIARGASDLQRLTASPMGSTRAQGRRLIARIADEMLRFTSRVNAEVPLFRSAMDSSLNALTNAAMISADFNNEQPASARTAIVNLLEALNDAHGYMIEFRRATLALPRISKEINSAKLKQAEALQSLILEFENAKRLLLEARAVIETLIDGVPQT